MIMGVGRELWKFRRTLVLILTPILLLPLLLFSPAHLKMELACAYTILLMAVYWVTEVVPLAVTALLPLVFYPLLGVVSAKETSIQYLKDVNVLFLGGLAVAVAVEHWNLHKRIALKVLTFVGAKPRWLLFGFMITTAFLSMWISNVATTAMMIPIAQAVLTELTTDRSQQKRSSTSSSDSRDEESGYTSTPHIVRGIDRPATDLRITVTEHSDDDGDVSVKYQPNNQPSPDSTKKSYYLLANNQPNGGSHSPTIEKRDSLTTISEAGPDASTTQLIELQDKPVDSFNLLIDKEKRNQNLAKALTICVCYAANIGGTATLTGTGPNLIMAGQFKSTYKKAPEIDFGSWVCFAFPGMLIFLMFAWFWIQYLYIGINWREIFPCFNKNSTLTREEKQAEDLIKKQYSDLGPMSFAEISLLTLFISLALLWLTRDPGFIPGWGSLSIFKKGYVSDATVAMAITFILFIFPSRRPNFFCCRAKNDRTDSGPVPALLTWSVVQQKMAWNVILLLGGSFAMALGSKESGLSAWIGMQMTPLKSLNPALANLICCAVVCALTQCTSNTATATVFLPILAELGEVLGVNPLYLMLPTTVITSYAFMLPVSTPPNAIAYSYGHLKMGDMMKAGAMLNVVGIFIAMFSVHVFGGPAFGVFVACPDWLHSEQCSPQNATDIFNATTAVVSTALNLTTTS